MRNQIQFTQTSQRGSRLNSNKSKSKISFNNYIKNPVRNVNWGLKIKDKGKANTQHKPRRDREDKRVAKKMSRERVHQDNQCVRIELRL